MLKFFKVFEIIHNLDKRYIDKIIINTSGKGNVTIAM